MSAADVWEFLAGLGIFMFGMFLLEESIRNLSGRTFRISIRKYTSTPPKAVMTGAIATAVLQSSSAVTLMVLAFTGAGIMALRNAMGVIFGSNLGTTFTSWLVAMLGFKMSIEAFAMPFIGVGGLGLIFFGKSLRGSSLSKLTVGFGFLFMGLDYMRRGTESLFTAEMLQLIPDLGPAVYVLGGFMLTAALQSSSASMAVILSVLYGGALGYQDAAAMVIGSNLGTTITAMIGSVGGSIVKKRVGMAHFLFNAITAIVAFAMLQPLSTLIFDQLGFVTEPVLGLALFHTVFNLLGVMLCVPALPWFTLLVERLIPDKQESPTRFIGKTTADVPEAALVSLRQEVHSLIKAAMTYNEHLLGVGLATPGALAISARNSPASLDAEYADLKRIQDEIHVFASRLPGQKMTEEEAVLLNRMLSAVRSAIASTKTLKDVRHELEQLETSECAYLNNRRAVFCRQMIQNHTALCAVIATSDATAPGSPANPEVLPKLLEALKSILAHDSEVLADTMHGLSAGSFTSAHISVLLSTNRAFTLSSRQILLSVKDLVATTHDANLFENFDLSGA